MNKPDTNDRARRYFDPQPLANFVSGQPRLLLIRKELVGDLPASMRFEMLREAGDLEIGLVALR
jgi:hypothetical protein